MLVIEKDFLKLDNDITKSFKKNLQALKRKKEEQNIKTLKKRFNGYIPSINRSKSARLGRLLIASTLAVSLSVPTCLSIMRKEKELAKLEAFDINSLTGNSYLISNDDINVIADNDIITNDKMVVELPFDDRTTDAINKEGESKLDVVKRNTSFYLENFINRYGLPRNITYALCTQERGLLDEDLQTNNFCNPMQVSTKHSGELFVIPIYENGILTGEYDKFYVFSKDDPKLKEHPNDKVLIIEDSKDNFQIGCACFWQTIDKYKNVFLALDAYNKGLSAFSNLYEKPLISVANTLEYYENNFNDFSWLSYINEYYKIAKNDEYFTHGDPNYVLNVLRYLETNNLGTTEISYYYKGEQIEFSLINTNKLVNNDEIAYNSNSGRR